MGDLLNILPPGMTLSKKFMLRLHEPIVRLLGLEKPLRDTKFFVNDQKVERYIETGAYEAKVDTVKKSAEEIMRTADDSRIFDTKEFKDALGIKYSNAKKKEKKVKEGKDIFSVAKVKAEFVDDQKKKKGR